MKDYKAHEKELREKRIQAILTSKELTSKQKKIAHELNKHLIQAEVSDETRRHYLQCFKLLVKDLKDLNKDLDQVKRNDISEYILLLKNKYKYKQKTVREKKKFLFTFYGWFLEKPKKELQEGLLRDVIFKGSDNTKLPEEILTVEEIRKMVQVATSLRDKALIFCLYESGCRKSEFLGLKIKHIQLDDYGAILVVYGKTGARRVRLIDSVPDLVNWLNAHEHRDEPDNPLWVTQGTWKGRALGKDALTKILKSTSKRAGIKKKIYAHLFRHSRATELAKDLTEAQMRIIFGWSKDSKTPSIYVHLSGRDVDQKLLEIKGQLPKKEKDKAQVLKPVICAFCKHKNSGVNKFCANCSRPLRDEDKVDILKAKMKVVDTSISKQKPINKELVKEVLREMIKKGEIEIT